MNRRLLSPVQALFVAGLAALGVFTILAGLRSEGYLQRPELAHYDWVLARRASDALAQDVVVVAVDDEDLRSWGWPLSDGQVANIIDALSSAGAAVIGIDIYRDNEVIEGRQQLEAAFLKTNAIWVVKLNDRGGLSIEAPDFAQNDGSVGFADIPVDADGVARRGILLVSGTDRISLAFSTQLALRATGQNSLKAWPDDPRTLLFGQTPVRRLEDGFGSYRGLDDTGYQLLLDYTNALPMAPIVLARDLLFGQADADMIEGKVALIGVTSKSIKDDFRTPLNNPPQMPFSYGVLVHAATTQQLIDYAVGRSQPMRSPGQSAHLAIIFAGALFGALAGVLSRTVLTVILLGPGLAIAIGAALSTLLSRGIWLPVVPTSVAWFAAFLLALLTVGIISRRQRQAIAKLFSDHLSPELTAEIWNARDILFAGGKPRPRRLRVSVLLADLEGSTTVGGSAEPGAFMDWTSRILDVMSQVARENGGFIEKFTGDGILVVFGAPLPRTAEEDIQKDAVAACRTALQISYRIDRLNAEGGLLAPYGLRIGLHSGVVLGGTLGSAGSLQYNIMGDTVNVAARIEAFGKALQDRGTSATTICASADLRELVGGDFMFQPVGHLIHDDKSREIGLFLLTGSAQKGAS
ncbi:CHASE2 domain-containing protein [Ruegeria sp. HKCCSP351]|uniref:CHASE2 domain-containing protein n=1 Tax=Ruegeria sp. HKCCSP351 TaxID=2794832 RepID=UPI001AE1A068|nr:CHASE2 domain-containing protein [Ruegeria sp. HKCCSP351]